MYFIKIYFKYGKKTQYIYPNFIKRNAESEQKTYILTLEKGRNKHFPTHFIQINSEEKSFNYNHLLKRNCN